MTMLLVKLLKLFAFILCFVLFYSMMKDVYEKFSKKMTNVGIMIEGNATTKNFFPASRPAPGVPSKTTDSISRRQTLSVFLSRAQY